jgi:hypothetical protein
VAGHYTERKIMAPLTKSEQTILKKSIFKKHQPCGFVSTLIICGSKKYSENLRLVNALFSLSKKGLAAILETRTGTEPKYNATTVYYSEYTYRLTPAGIEKAETYI